MHRTALFDLDGTLIDTIPDLTASLNRALATAGLAPFETAAVRPMVGDGVVRLVARALTARGVPPSSVVLEAFEADYLANVAVASAPFPGIPETLGKLAQNGWRMAVCTNKPETAAHKLLAAFGLSSRFAAIGGGDSFTARKPDPTHLRLTLAKAGGALPHAVMIGDHANDMKAAAGAGIPAVFASWGYGPLAMAGGATVAARVSDLPELLEAKLPRGEDPSPRADAPQAAPPAPS